MREIPAASFGRGHNNWSFGFPMGRVPASSLPCLREPFKIVVVNTLRPRVKVYIILSFPQSMFSNRGCHRSFSLLTIRRICWAEFWIRLRSVNIMIRLLVGRDFSFHRTSPILPPTSRSEQLLWQKFGADRSPPCSAQIVHGVAQPLFHTSSWRVA